MYVVVANSKGQLPSQERDLYEADRSNAKGAGAGVSTPVREEM